MPVRAAHRFPEKVERDSVVGVITVGTRQWGVAMSPDGTKAYTANGPSNDVAVVDLATRRVVKRIPVGRVPWGVAAAPR
jgi:YVTN family beta-propeller protein